MRALLSWMLAVGLAAAPAIARAAGPGDGKDKDASAASKSDKATDTKAAKSESSSAPVKPATTTIENELQQMKDLLEAQSRQIQLQNEQLRLQQAKMEAMEADLKTANTNVANLSSATSAVLAAKPAGTAAGPAIDPELYFTGADEKNPDEPLSIHYKGITLTPGGFLAAESVYRNRALSADVNTPYINVPFPFANSSAVGENNFSGRQSRITLLGEGKLDNVKLSGYFETDWLSSGTTSNNNQSNSYTNRVRQLWGQAAFSNGITVTGGQMWTLATENKHGMDNRTEGTPMTIDANYTVGFTFGRQYAVRVTKNFGDKLWLGLAVEDNQFSNNLLINAAHGLGGTNSAFAATGNNGGLFNNTNNYSINPSPDFIVKAAWEPGWGHYEVFGIVTVFRSRIFPCEVGVLAAGAACGTGVVPNTQLANNQNVTAGGVGGHARLPLFNKKLDVILTGLWGDGTGRYAVAGLTDITLHQNGSVEPIHNGQAMVGLELHPTPSWDLYGYGGVEYDARTWYVNAAGTGTLGYGSPFFNNANCFTEVAPTAGGLATTGNPGGCTGDTRMIAEGTIGFWHRFFQGPKGRLQFGMQYSYVERAAWSGCPAAFTGGTCATGTTAPAGPENMFFTSLRYYIP